MIGEFISEYLPTIVITVFAGLIFFIASLYFLRYKEKSAEYERYKKAKETVIDVLESSLINKQSISPERIKHLISAAEREQNVELIDSPKSLVEDLELRFEKSKQLDTEQQWHYIDQIEELIAKIERESIISSVPLSHGEILISLKENIEAEKKDDALKGLEKLSTKIKELSERRQIHKLSRLSDVAAILAVIVAIATIFTFLTMLLGGLSPTPSPQPSVQQVDISITDINNEDKELIVHGKVSLEKDQYTLVFAKGYPLDRDAKGYYVGNLPAYVSEGDFTSYMIMGPVPPTISVIGIVVESTSLGTVEPGTPYTLEYLEGIAIARTPVIKYEIK